MRAVRLILSLAFVAGATVATTSVRNVEAFHTKQHTEIGTPAPASLADIIAFVQLRGWPIDLGYLCKGFSLTVGNNKCAFRQIALHTKTAELDDHGFNVPTNEFPPLHIVIYHVTPLTGAFFLASKDGRLIEAISRARGTDFEPMSELAASAAFAAELSFWQSNFDQIERDTLKAK